MATRLVDSIAHKGCAAKVYFDSDLSEYRVKFYKEGKWQHGADHFTDDRDDACHTAHLEIARMAGRLS
jgi:hypothetical protein